MLKRQLLLSMYSSRNKITENVTILPFRIMSNNRVALFSDKSHSEIHSNIQKGKIYLPVSDGSIANISVFPYAYLRTEQNKLLLEIVISNGDIKVQTYSASSYSVTQKAITLNLIKEVTA